MVHMHAIPSKAFTSCTADTHGNSATQSICVLIHNVSEYRLEWIYVLIDLCSIANVHHNG